MILSGTDVVSKVSYVQREKPISKLTRVPLAGPAISVETLPATMACSDYRIDVSAVSFGLCRCGFPKRAHSFANAGEGRPLDRANVYDIASRNAITSPAPSVRAEEEESEEGWEDEEARLVAAEEARRQAEQEARREAEERRRRGAEERARAEAQEMLVRRGAEALVRSEAEALQARPGEPAREREDTVKSCSSRRTRPGHDAT